MKIKSMTFKNFKQYRDFQINFDLNDDEKNITVIRAANSTGKTTFIQGIKWCFFGDDEVDTTKSSELLNIDELETCRNSGVEETFYKVIIEILDDNEILKLTRTQYLRVLNHQVKKTECNVSMEYPNEFGETMIIKDNDKEKTQIIQKRINSLLPKRMINYFLFDGERIEKLSSTGIAARREINQAITSVSSLPILNNALETINLLLRKVSNEKANSSSNEEYKLIQKKSSELDDEIVELTNNLEEVKIDCEKNENKLKEVERELSSLEDVSTLQKERKTLSSRIEKLINENEKRYNEIQSDYMDYNNAKYIFLLRKKYNQIDLGEGIEEKTIPNMEVSAIDTIIKNGICICGTTLTNAHIEKLENQRNYQPPMSEEAMKKGYEFAVEKKVSNINILVRTIKSKINDYNNIFIEITEAEKRIKKISEIINEMKEDEIIQLEKRYKDLNNIVSQQKFQINNIKQELDQKNNQNKIYINQLKQMAEKLKFNRLLEVQEELLIKSKSHLESLIRKDETELRKYVEEFANKHFQDIILKSKTISISEKFSLKVKEENGRESNISSGESVAVSISIILSIIDTYKHNLQKKNDKKDVYNLISEKDFFVAMDGPFAMLDQYFSKNIATKISENLDQVILLTNDNQYNESIQNAFRPKLSKEYILNIPPNNRKDSIITDDLEEVKL